MAEEKEECFICHTTEDERVLLPCRNEGDDKFVCVTCLPALIHGGH